MGNLSEIAFMIIILAVTVSISAGIFENYADSVLVTSASSSSGSILADNGTITTLSPVGTGITSSSVTAKNQTWLSFDGDGGVSY